MRAGAADIGGSGCELCLLTPDIRPLRQQLRRQTRRDPWRCDPVERPAFDVHAFRRPRHQRRECVDVLRQRLPQRRHGRPLIGEYAFLLRHIKIGPGTGFQSLLDRIQDTRGHWRCSLGGANPVLRGKHLEISIGDAGQRRQSDHVAVETIRGRSLFCGQRGIAVLAPEIEL